MALWLVRQNGYKKTNQHQMYDFIMTNGCVTCPFGHIGHGRNNVIDGTYNPEANRQDRMFDKDMNIGDIILIPFSGRRAPPCILARIVSDPIYAYDTKLFITMTDDAITISTTGDTPFRPVVRKIQVIRNDITFTDKRVLPRMSLCRLNQTILTPFL